MTTKRHCMIVHAYYPLGEVRVQREAEALVDQGYEVDVICLRVPGEPSRTVYHGVHVYRMPVRRHKERGAVVQFLEYLAFFLLAGALLTARHMRRRYTSVQVHNLPDFLVFAALGPKLTGVPVILDLHDLMPEFFAARFGKDWDSLTVRLVRWQERLACRFADHVITVTEHWRQSLIRRGVPPERCSVLMNLADPRIFRRPPGRLPPSDGRFRLIYHGAIPRRYGLDLVLRAIAQVRDEIPALLFVIVGQGEYEEELRRLARELGIERQVRFEDFRPVEEIPPLVLASDVAVVPYRDDVFTGELLPTKLLEYAALGIPAIAARTAGIQAYFDDSMVEFFTPGDVADLARCIRRLYHDPERRAELARNIEAFNQRYNWPAQSAEYVRLVTRLSAGRRGGGKRR